MITVNIENTIRADNNKLHSKQKEKELFWDKIHFKAKQQQYPINVNLQCHAFLLHKVKKGYYKPYACSRWAEENEFIKYIQMRFPGNTDYKEILQQAHEIVRFNIKQLREKAKKDKERFNISVKVQQLEEARQKKKRELEANIVAFKLKLLTADHRLFNQLKTRYPQNVNKQCYVFIQTKLRGKNISITQVGAQSEFIKYMQATYKGNEEYKTILKQPTVISPVIPKSTRKYFEYLKQHTQPDFLYLSPVTSSVKPETNPKVGVYQKNWFNLEVSEDKLTYLGHIAPIKIGPTYFKKIATMHYRNNRIHTYYLVKNKHVRRQKFLINLIKIKQRLILLKKYQLVVQKYPYKKQLKLFYFNINKLNMALPKIFLSYKIPIFLPISYYFILLHKLLVKINRFNFLYARKKKSLGYYQSQKVRKHIHKFKTRLYFKHIFKIYFKNYIFFKKKIYNYLRPYYKLIAIFSYLKLYFKWWCYKIFIKIVYYNKLDFTKFYFTARHYEYNWLINYFMSKYSPKGRIPWQFELSDYLFRLLAYDSKIIILNLYKRSLYDIYIKNLTKINKHFIKINTLNKKIYFAYYEFIDFYNDCHDDSFLNRVKKKTFETKYLTLIKNFIYASGHDAFASTDYKKQFFCLYFKPEGKPNITIIRRRKAIFKLKLILRKLFIGLYQQTNLPLFLHRLHNYNIFNSYVLKPYIIHRKKFQITITTK